MPNNLIKLYVYWGVIQWQHEAAVAGYCAMCVRMNELKIDSKIFKQKISDVEKWKGVSYNFIDEI